MSLLRPSDFDDLLLRTGIALQVDADRTHMGPHGATDRKGRALILFFAPKPPAYDAVVLRFTRLVNLAARIGAQVATPVVVHVLGEWLVFVEHASGEELCLADWLVLRPSHARRAAVAQRLREAISLVHAHRVTHGNLTARHVLVGGAGEVVLAGLSLHALVDGEREPATLAVDADGGAVTTLLRLLLGAEADEWTDGAFTPPALAATGTLTIATPLPVSGTGPAASTSESTRTPTTIDDGAPTEKSVRRSRPYRPAALGAVCTLLALGAAGLWASTRPQRGHMQEVEVLDITMKMTTGWSPSAALDAGDAPDSGDARAGDRAPGAAPFSPPATRPPKATKKSRDLLEDSLP